MKSMERESDDAPAASAKLGAGEKGRRALATQWQTYKKTAERATREKWDERDNSFASYSAKGRPYKLYTVLLPF